MTLFSDAFIQVSPQAIIPIVFPIFGTSGLFFPIFEKYPKVDIIFPQTGV